MTKRECAVIMTYTGVCMLTGDDINYFYEYIDELIGIPIFSHETPALSDYLKEKAKPDFIRLCREAAEPKAKTNADKIRAMTDEQLAEWLDLHGECNQCAYHPAQCSVECYEGHMKWLKEVSEDAAD